MADAAAVLERLASSDMASVDDRTGHLKTSSQLYMQAKQYSKAAHVAETALDEDPREATFLELAGQANYLASDFQGAVDKIGPLVALTESKRDTPREEWLQILLNSYYRLNDREQTARTWVSLLRHSSSRGARLLGSPMLRSGAPISVKRT